MPTHRDEKIKYIRKELQKNNKCTHCKPHRGENANNKKNKGRKLKNKHKFKISPSPLGESVNYHIVYLDEMVKV